MGLFQCLIKMEWPKNITEFMQFKAQLSAREAYTLTIILFEIENHRAET